MLEFLIGAIVGGFIGFGIFACCLASKKEVKPKSKNDIEVENMVNKIGSILQSLKATPEEVKQAYDSVFNNANKCVRCGEVIPEGRLICPKCESEVEGK